MQNMSLHGESSESEIDAIIAEAENLVVPRTPTSTVVLGLSPNSVSILNDIENINRLCESSNIRMGNMMIGSDLPINMASNENPRAVEEESMQISSINRPSISREAAANVAPREIVDLSNLSSITSDGDDDVVFVSSNVIDLCTPVRNNCQRRRQFLHNGPESYKRAGYQQSNQDDKSMNDGNRDSLTCAICMNTYMQRCPTSTKCGHVFCQQCIYEALKVNAKCPLCNTKIFKKHLTRLYM